MKDLMKRTGQIRDELGRKVAKSKVIIVNWVQAI